jgi:hypothetical protein
MNHRPFEDWLLDDQPLDPQQQRDLQDHLRTCVACSAIAESNIALHTTHLIAPAASFTDRFTLRLARRREEQRWQQIIGTSLLVLAGLAVTLVVAGPSLQEAFTSPAGWITAVVGYFLFLVTSLRVFSEAGAVLLRVLPGFITPAGWFVSVFAFAGLCLLWGLSIRRFGRAPQGV